MDACKLTTFVPRLLIRLYQAVRLGSPRRCRFYPACSDYMLESLDSHGLLAGTGAGILRILKCHPWHPGGYDPVASSPLVGEDEGGGTFLAPIRPPILHLPPQGGKENII